MAGDEEGGGEGMGEAVEEERDDREGAAHRGSPVERAWEQDGQGKKGKKKAKKGISSGVDRAPADAANAGMAVSQRVPVHTPPPPPPPPRKAHGSSSMQPQPPSPPSPPRNRVPLQVPGLVTVPGTHGGIANAHASTSTAGPPVTFPPQIEKAQLAGPMQNALPAGHVPKAQPAGHTQPAGSTAAAGPTQGSGVQSTGEDASADVSEALAEAGGVLGDVTVGAKAAARVKRKLAALLSKKGGSLPDTVVAQLRDALSRLVQYISEQQVRALSGGMSSAGPTGHGQPQPPPPLPQQFQAGAMTPMQEGVEGQEASVMGSFGRMSVSDARASHAAPGASVAHRAQAGEGEGVGRGEDEDEGMCVVCLDEERCVTFWPCGHRIACMTCSLSWRERSGKCPYCDREVEMMAHDDTGWIR